MLGMATKYGAMHKQKLRQAALFSLYFLYLFLRIVILEEHIKLSISNKITNRADMVYKNSKDDLVIAVTGYTGSIGGYLLSYLAKGDLNKDDRPIDLRLHVRDMDKVENDKGENLERNRFGLEKELRDHGIITKITFTDQLEELFTDADCAFLIGSIPREAGKPRSSVLKPNAGIFTKQGQTINDFAKRNVKVLVVGNPSNTNALIVDSHTPDLEPNSVTSLMYLDAIRMRGKVGCKLNIPPNMIENAFAMGNHSDNLVPNLDNATINGEPLLPHLDQEWYLNKFTESIQKRGGEIKGILGRSSSSSAAAASLSHMSDWLNGTQGRIVSMGVPSNGSYGINEGVIFGLPVTVDDNGRIEIIEDMKIKPANEYFMEESYYELLQEKSEIYHLLNHESKQEQEMIFDIDHHPAPEI